MKTHLRNERESGVGLGIGSFTAIEGRVKENGSYHIMQNKRV